VTKLSEFIAENPGSELDYADQEADVALVGVDMADPENPANVWARLISLLEGRGVIRLTSDIPVGGETLEILVRRAGANLVHPVAPVSFEAATGPQAINNAPGRRYVAPTTIEDAIKSVNLGEISGAVTINLALGVNFSGQLVGDTVISFTGEKDNIPYGVNLKAKGAARNVKFGDGVATSSGFDNVDGADVAEDALTLFRVGTRLNDGDRFTTVSGFEVFGAAPLVAPEFIPEQTYISPAIGPSGTNFVVHSGAGGSPAPTIEIAGWWLNGDLIADFTDDERTQTATGDLEVELEATNSSGTDTYRVYASCGPKIPLLLGVSALNKDAGGTALHNLSLPSLIEGFDLTPGLPLLLAQTYTSAGSSGYTYPTGFTLLGSPVPHMSAATEEQSRLHLSTGVLTSDHISAGLIADVQMRNYGSAHLLVLSGLGSWDWTNSVTRSGSSAGAKVRDAVLHQRTLADPGLGIAFMWGNRPNSKARQALLTGWQESPVGGAYGSDGNGLMSGRVFTRRLSHGMSPAGTVVGTGSADAVLSTALAVAVGPPL